MRKFRRILVALDFSPASRAALKAAERAATWDEGRVTVLHVMDPLLASEIKQSRSFTDEQLYQDMEERLRLFMSRSDVSHEGMQVEVDIGYPFVGIVNACNRLRANLLVLGTRGSQHGPNQVGTMAAKCVRKAPADVLLVREHMTKPFQKVLACVDFSETSARAVCYARKIAEHEHAQLECLYVFQSALALSLDYGGYLPASSLRPETEALENWQKRLDDFVGALLQDAKDVFWRALVEERPNVRESIYDFVQTEGVDLVVLGTRGRTDLRSLIMGSTAEKIISRSPCSVLAIKPKGFDYAIQ